jgi:PAP_fibrillin
MLLGLIRVIPPKLGCTCLYTQYLIDVSMISLHFAEIVCYLDNKSGKIIRIALMPPQEFITMSGKAELLTLLTNKNLGIAATPDQKATIGLAIAQLEASNPTLRPLEATTMLEGDWQLLYTTSRELLGLDRIPFINVGAIYQCIRTADAKIYNIAEVVGIPFLAGIISVVADFKPLSERRVEVQFTRAIWGAQRFIDYESPDRFIREIESGAKFKAIDFPIPARTKPNADGTPAQNGWLDVTYLDDDLRVGRGSQDSVFVLKRV